MLRQCQWSTRVLTSVCRLTVRTSSRRILPALAMSDDDESPAQEPRKPRGRGWMPSLFRFFSQPSERGKRDREYYEKLPIDAKRALYSCGEDYVTMNDIPTWEEFAVGYPCPRNVSRLLPAAVHLSQKVSLWRGDITRLEIDAIVNAANSSLLGGGGVDGAIHRAAGSSLREECAALSGCSTGDAKITSGHKLPAKYILHTVGPMNCSEQRLRSCYSRCLELVLENSIRSVAFCCIATGIYGYPNEEAAHIALETIRRWLETDNNADQVDRVIFCVFLKVDYNIYRDLLHHYFPVETDDGGEEGGRTPPPEETADGESGEREEEGESMPAVPSLDRSVTEPSKSTASSSTPSKQLHQQPSSPTSQQDQQEGNPQPSHPTGQQDQQEGVPQPSRPTGQVDQQEGVPQPSSPTGQVDQREKHKEEVKGTEEEAQLLQEAEGTVEQEMVEENDKRE